MPKMQKYPEGFKNSPVASRDKFDESETLLLRKGNKGFLGGIYNAWNFAEIAQPASWKWTFLYNVHDKVTQYL